eukprot:2765242-Alexandrium_andersonii.AAC.1
MRGLGRHPHSLGAVTHPYTACLQVASVASMTRAALARGTRLRFVYSARCPPRDAAARRPCKRHAFK